MPDPREEPVQAGGPDPYEDLPDTSKPEASASPGLDGDVYGR